MYLEATQGATGGFDRENEEEPYVPPHRDTPQLKPAVKTLYANNELDRDKSEWEEPEKEGRRYVEKDTKGIRGEELILKIRE